MRYILTFVLCLTGIWLFGQQDRLADDYYRNGEYEKAAATYKSLYEGNGRNRSLYIERYLSCLKNLEQYELANDFIEKLLKAEPKSLYLYVMQGDMYEQQGLSDKAEKCYEKSLDKIIPENIVIQRLATAFARSRNYEYAAKAYMKGGEVLNDPGLFAMQIGDMYRNSGDKSRMIEYYLLSLKTQPKNINRVKNNLARYITEEDYLDLEQQIFIQIQEDEASTIYPELLEWLYIQQKDYKNALRQVKALDRRRNEQGIRVMNLAMIANNAKDYDAAIEAYEYITEELGKTSPHYLEAKRNALTSRKKRVLKGGKFEMSELDSLKSQYNAFLNEFGRNSRTAGLMLELAKMQSLYMNDLGGANDILNEIISYAGMNRATTANAKLALADNYLIQGEVWEATLLYSQVDKEFREDYLGEVARYKNALLFYYNGEFEWASAQFNILKAATSRLISNDAIDRSVFILDNLGLDTIATPLQMYARAELLNFQHKYDESFAKLDSLREMFPDHKLEDDIFYLKALIYQDKRDYDAAIAMYEKVVNDYPEDIRADNSLFNMAELYEHKLDDLEKAQNLYERIFIDYSNSTFAVEARKRFRKLRGDVVQ